MIDIDLGGLIQTMWTPDLNCMLVKKVRGGPDHSWQLLSHILLAGAFGTRDSKFVLASLVVCKES